MPEVTALMAAKQLAADLKLPAQCGSVFVWYTDQGLCLVVAADHDWLAHQDFQLHEYLGFPVQTRDRIVGVAYQLHY